MPRRDDERAEVAAEEERARLLLDELRNATRRTAIAAFLHQHYEELTGVLSKPDWGDVAATFRRLGYVDARGNPPTAEGLRLAWYRERRARAASGPAQRHPPTPRRQVSPPAVDSSEPVRTASTRAPVQAPSPPSSPSAEDAPRRMKVDLTPTRASDVYGGEPAAPKPLSPSLEHALRRHSERTRVPGQLPAQVKPGKEENNGST